PGWRDAETRLQPSPCTAASGCESAWIGVQGNEGRPTCSDKDLSFRHAAQYFPSLPDARIRFWRLMFTEGSASTHTPCQATRPRSAVIAGHYAKQSGSS